MRRIHLATVATTYGSGPYHPAVGCFGTIHWYWPNVTFDNEDAAYQWAAKVLAETQQEAEDRAALWNVVRP